MEGAAHTARVEHQMGWQRQAERVRNDPLKAFAALMRTYQQSFAAMVSLTRGDGLDLQGFDRMVREHLYLSDVPTGRVCTWFEACETDKDGLVTAMEWFRFSARASIHQCNVMLKRLQEQQARKKEYGQKEGGAANVMGEVLVDAFDKTGDGQIDRREFNRLAAKLGFGDLADDIFDKIDNDRSGVVDKGEIVKLLGTYQSHSKPAALAAVGDFTMAITHNSEAARAKERATAEALRSDDNGLLVQASTMERLSNAVLQPPHSFFIGGVGSEAFRAKERAAAIEAFRQELVAALARSKTRVFDLFIALDCDGDRRIKRGEMRSALRSMLKVETLPAGVVDAIFDELDTDFSNELGYEELDLWLQSGDVPKLDFGPSEASRRPTADGPGVGAMMLQRRRVSRMPPPSAREQLEHRETIGAPASHRKAPLPQAHRDRFKPGIALASPKTQMMMHITLGERPASAHEVQRRRSESLDKKKPSRARTATFAWSPFALDLLWNADVPAGGRPRKLSPTRRVWRDAPLYKRPAFVPAKPKKDKVGGAVDVGEYGAFMRFNH